MFAILKRSDLLFRHKQKECYFLSSDFRAKTINRIKQRLYKYACSKKNWSNICVRVHVYARARCARIKWRDWHYIRTTEMRQYWYAGVLVEGRHRLMSRHRSLSVGRFDETDTMWRAVTGFFITQCTGLYSLSSCIFLPATLQSNANIIKYF